MAKVAAMAPDWPPSPRDFDGSVYVFAPDDEAGYAQHFRGADCGREANEMESSQRLSQFSYEARIRNRNNEDYQDLTHHGD